MQRLPTHWRSRRRTGLQPGLREDLLDHGLLMRNPACQAKLVQAIATAIRFVRNPPLTRQREL